MSKLEHQLSVSFTNENGWYTEYDVHGRIVYYKDSHNYFAYQFYHSESHLRTPYFVLHKYHVLYNPEFYV